MLLWSTVRSSIPKRFATRQDRFWTSTSCNLVVCRQTGKVDWITLLCAVTDDLPDIEFWMTPLLRTWVELFSTQPLSVPTVFNV